MRKLKVTYMNGHKLPDSEGIIDDLKYKSVMVDRNYTKIFPAAMYRLMQLNGCPVKLFLYLCERCTEENLVHTGKTTIDNFNLFMKRATKGEEVYSDIAVKKAFADLRRVELLVPTGRGWSRINPIYFWKGELEQNRVDLIKKMLEDKSITEIDIDFDFD